MAVGGIYGQTGQHGNYDYSHANWKGGLAVGPGDAVYRDDADAYDKSAAGFTWTTDLATTQAAFKAAFRGYSMTRRLATQLTDGGISDGEIAESGEWVKPCAALGAAAVVGALVGPAQGAGNTLHAQNVAIVATAARAIGVLSRDAAVGQTVLYYKIAPARSVSRGVQAIV